MGCQQLKTSLSQVLLQQNCQWLAVPPAAVLSHLQGTPQGLVPLMQPPCLLSALYLETADVRHPEMCLQLALALLKEPVTLQLLEAAV